ncbi:HlyD family efflux transporter periplasmic adaptor subunit [Pseudoalteromonas sp. OOF1S-7]|uniref:HlyD family secretion protein n=1 Tax=Pseudoalteromonas sp. OOF1S-7 TaxID=2917757 RepID=UPI001EF6C059|nr:HlyD family efflux transporter periplasmic adaptor subunit [Pseudoalteromonas sp. OOF1S-7]MCG7536142.1 HlyD family efflux transporter periplasmic adaptor subunit [Pseudoalteromonas sp. OOF1S-7]
MVVRKKRSIIRPEVIEARIGIQGDVLMIRPLSFRYLCLFFILVLLLVCGFMVYAEFTKSTRVRGIIKSPLGVTKVLPRQSGVIDTLFVQEGESVQKGQPLYQIRTEQNGVSGSVSKEVTQSLIESLKLVEEKLQFQVRLNDLELQEAERKIAQIKRDAAHTQEQLALEREYQQLLGKELSEIETLYKNQQVSKVEYNGKYAQYLEKRIAVKALVKQHDDLIATAEDETLKRQNIGVNGHAMVLEYRQKINALKREITNAGAQEAYRILAPHDGVIANIYYQNGHFAQQGQVLMNLLPDESELVAEIYIPTSAIGLVNEGQAINLRYHAFPYQEFGLFKGHIYNISQTLIEPHQAEASNLVEGPVYRAQVTLQQQSLYAKGKEVGLQAGMTLDADVLGETRTILAWVFEPLAEKVSGAQP